MNINDENEISLEKARKLLGNTDISDEKLEKIMRKIKILCKVTYHLYVAQVDKKQDQQGNINEVANKDFDSEE